MTTRVFLLPAAVLTLTGLLAGCGASTKMVMVKSAPEGADVTIAGKSVGATPVNNYEVEFKKSDSLELLVSKDYYLPFTATIKNDGAKKEAFEAVLVKVADATLDATPTADVYLGAEKLGTTPLDYRLVFNKSDAISLTFKADGYQDMTKTFAIDGPNTYSVKADMDPLKHSETVFFDTDPQGATITMGFEYLCDTPCEIELDDMNPKAKPQLKIERRGFASKLINLEYKGVSWRDQNYPKKMKVLLAPAAGNEAYDAKALGIAPKESSAAPMIIAPMMSGSQPAQQPVYYPQQQPVYQQQQPQYVAPQQMMQQPAQQQQMQQPVQQQQMMQQPVQQQMQQPVMQQPAAVQEPETPAQ
ncbi:PEGA domain-containing protein [Oceanobacter mangrovi]|uniref:PEGA domain-containing protein n=1 Tax=Oceanobacter mangrovi TaxID=2862510 RepID=UPI001C8DA3D8|nr:PEGA domain-containing protein [Oceanobacter mangrovi]